MPVEASVKEQGEIHTLMLEGSLGDADVADFARLVIERFKHGCSSVIIDLEKVDSLSGRVTDYLYKLNDELLGRGAYLAVVRPQGDLSPRCKVENGAKCVLQVESNRHIALGELLSRLSVKRELLDYIQKTESLVYTVPEREDSPEYKAVFVRNLQNFLVLNPGEEYDKDIRKGVRLHFEFEVGAEEEADPGKLVSFDAEVYKFAILVVDGKKSLCFVIRVPDLLDVQDKRRDPRLDIELRMSFWGSSGDRIPRSGWVNNISESGLQFRTSRINHRIGDEIFCDVDFKMFKFSEPQRCRIVRLEHLPTGEMQVACEFLHLMGRDQGMLEDFILNYC